MGMIFFNFVEFLSVYFEYICPNMENANSTFENREIRRLQKRAS